MRGLLGSCVSVWIASAIATGCGSSANDTSRGAGAPDASPDVSSEGEDAGVTGHDSGATSDAGMDARGIAPGEGGTAVDAGAIQPAPQVANLGGTELKTPKVQLVGYASDTFLTDVDAFIKEYGTTTEWAEQASEYGIGAFTKLPTIMLPGTPPTSFDDNTGSPTPFEQMVASNVSGASPAWSPADGNTMYVFLLPLGTNITSGGSCCTGFLGYHYEAPLASGSAPYAVVCHCAAMTGDPITPLEYVTTTVNHEMVETATDPFPNTSPAFAQTDDADAIWTIATGGEVADMCEDNTDSNYQPPGATYMIQRSWSNMAAKAGNNPCVPAPATGPYFNSYGIYSDAITLNYGGSWPTKGVKLAAGESKTIQVRLTSNGATSGPWNVKAWDLGYYLGKTANTTLTLDKSSGSDGDVLNLTIKVTSYDSTYAGAGVVLESTLGTQDNLTMFAIGQ
jgi:hypothetical protein